MPNSYVTYTPLWSGAWGGTPGTYIDLPSAASAFDAIRLTHQEDYSNMGGYKCSDIGTRAQTASIFNTFWENGWYNRIYALNWVNGTTRLTANYGQQSFLKSGQSWSGDPKGVYVTRVYGITYNDTDAYNTAKIYGDRTLIYSAVPNSARTSLQTTERMDNFAFLQIDTNNRFNSQIVPGFAKRLTFFGLLQADSSWYYRGTYWNVGSDSKTLNGSAYIQAKLNVYNSVDSGNIPVAYSRNVQPVKIWGIGRTASNS